MATATPSSPADRDSLSREFHISEDECEPEVTLNTDEPAAGPSISKTVSKRASKGSSSSAPSHLTPIELLSEKQKKLARVSKLDEKEILNNYWMMHRIEGHSIRPATNQVLYHIKWLGFGRSANTKDPLENLDGSKMLVTEYHEKHKLPAPSWVGPYGGSTSDRGRRDLWIEANSVVQQIRSEALRYFVKSPPIGINLFDGKLGAADGLYIILSGFHFYVALYYHQANFCFVADSEDAFLTKENCHRNVSSLLDGVKIQGIKFLSSYYRDMCGGYAVVAATEMLRLYNTVEHLHEWPSTISFPAERKKRVLHRNYGNPTRSRRPVPIPGERPPNISKRINLKCRLAPDCDWSTQSTNKQREVAHFLMAHKKK